MIITFKHNLLAFSTLALCVSACGDDTSSMDDEVGTGDDVHIPLADGCAPKLPEAEQEGEIITGQTFLCQGSGNGWLETSVYPLKSPSIDCVHYEGDKPKVSTPADCAPLTFEMLPADVSPPAACCTETTAPSDIALTCLTDCAYAACNLAIAQLQEAVDVLSSKGAEGVIKEDLQAIVNRLELPSEQEKCAGAVIEAQGAMAQYDLGGGTSGSLLFGHIENAKLHLQCAIDADEPYIAQAEGDGEFCDSPTNIPDAKPDPEMGGSIAAGAITLYGPVAETKAGLRGADFRFQTMQNRDGSVDFTLNRFDAEVEDLTAGSFAVSDVHVSLAHPAEALVNGETITFPAGALRFEVTAVVSVDGERLFEGEPISAHYSNFQPAHAVRTVDGSLAIVDAAFRVGEQVAILSTEPTPFAPDPGASH